MEQAEKKKEYRHKKRKIPSCWWLCDRYVCDRREVITRIII